VVETTKKPRVPSELERLLRGYLNTCQFMTRLWMRTMLVLVVLLPAGFYAAGKNVLEAGISGVGLCVLLGVITRFLVFEFRQFRAGRVAVRIDQRIPRRHPSREAVVEWIAEHNDGNFLNSVLKRLGVSPRTSRAYTTPLEENVVATSPAFLAFAEKLLNGSEGPSQSGGVQTYVYATTQTQVLNEDGEWVTVETSTTDGGEAVPPSEAVQKAMALLRPGGSDADTGSGGGDPPPDFEPIPLSAPSSDTPRAPEERPDRRESRLRLGYMPLQLDDYRPNENEDEEKDRSGVATAAREESR
jgi:hypothetical protein